MRVIITMGLLALAACKGGDETDETDTMGAMYNFSLTGSGYEPHAAKGVHVALVDASGAVVDTQDIATITDGAWTYSADAVLMEGAAYSVSWYADMSESPGCEAFAGDGTTVLDHVWKKAIPAVTADVALTHAHGTDFDPSGCEAFAGM